MKAKRGHLAETISGLFQPENIGPADVRLALSGEAHASQRKFCSPGTEITCQYTVQRFFLLLFFLLQRQSMIIIIFQRESAYGVIFSRHSFFLLRGGIKVEGKMRTRIIYTPINTQHDAITAEPAFVKSLR